VQPEETRAVPMIPGNVLGAMMDVVSDRTEAPEPKYQFAGLRLEFDGTLRRGESVIALPAKELAALEFLLAHAGQIVPTHQLRQALWGDDAVRGGDVGLCLQSLRARLLPDECIQAVYKRGYRLAGEVRRGGCAEQPLTRLAILPFATGYGVAEHLGAAIAEQSATRLTALHSPRLAVLARDSVASLTSLGKTTQQIGHALRADLLLTGALNAADSHYRLRAEMVRGSDGASIWVEDIFVEQIRLVDLESELAERVAFRLNIESASLSPQSGQISLLAASTDEPEVTQRREAYELLLRGRHEGQTLQRHHMQDGLRHLQRAIELDPELLPAKTDLVHLCVMQAFYGYMAPHLEAELARRAAASVPDLHQVELMLPALGWISFHVDHNLSEARRAFSLSAHLPHSQWTTRARCIFALSRHRFAEAIDLLHTALLVDPFSPWLHIRLAWAYHLAGERKESVALIHHALSTYPACELSNLHGSIILAYNGETARASQLARQAAEASPFLDLATAAHAYTLAREGHKNEARAMLERLQWLGRERFVLRAFNAVVYVALDDQENALAELRAAEQNRCPWFFQILADPRLEALHGYPEFERMRAILPRMEAEAEDEAGFEV